jgi:ribosomal protein S18 acetylase RimI-like enzyme
MGKRQISRMLELMNWDWIWVAVEGKRQVGFVTVRPEGGGLHLIWIDVHPDQERRGIGSALLNEVIQAGKDLGLGPIICEVWDENEKALNFYDKHGFRRYRWMEDYYKNGLNAWQLLKDI